MGILNKSFGTISGRVGDLIYYQTKDGKQACRKAPKPSTKEPTRAQLVQRANFAAAVAFLQPFRPIYGILSKTDRKHHPFSVAVKQILQDAVYGEYPDYHILYAAARIFKGNSATRVRLAVKRNGAQISYHWNFTDYCTFHSNVMMIAYAPGTHQLVYSVAEEHGSEGSSTLPIPSHLQAEPLETWMIFISHDRRMASHSIYGGVQS